MADSEARKTDKERHSRSSERSDLLRRSLSEKHRYRPARVALLKRTNTLRQQALATNAASHCTVQLPGDMQFSFTVDSIQEDFEEDSLAAARRAPAHAGPDDGVASATELCNAPSLQRSLIINEHGEGEDESEQLWSECGRRASSRSETHMHAHAYTHTQPAPAASDCEATSLYAVQLSCGTLNKPNKQYKQNEPGAPLINRAFNALNSVKNQQGKVPVKPVAQHAPLVATASNTNSALLCVDNCDNQLDERYRSQSLSVFQINTNSNTLNPASPACSPARPRRTRKKSDTLSIVDIAQLGLTSSIYVDRMARRSVVALPSSLDYPASRSASPLGSVSINSSRHSLSPKHSRGSMRANAKMVDATVQVNLTAHDMLSRVNNAPSDGSATGSMLSISATHLQPASSAPTRHKNRVTLVAARDDKRHVATRPASDLLQLIGTDYLRYSGIQTFKQLQPVKELQRHAESTGLRATSEMNALPHSSSTPSLSDSANASPDIWRDRLDFGIAPKRQPAPAPAMDEPDDCAQSMQHSDDALDKSDNVPQQDNAAVAIEFCPQVESAAKTTLLRPDSSTKTTEQRSSTISRQPVARRLARRKEIFLQRRLVANCTFTACLIGLLLMIAENEITLSIARQFSFNHSADDNRSIAIIAYKESTLSVSIKALISASTVVLEIFIAIHHILEMRLFLIENGVVDWRLAVTTKRALQFGLEFIVCAIHPVPFLFYDAVILWPEVLSSTSRDDLAKVPVDVFLSVPMFLRSYLALRVVVIHSRLLTDASSRSIGALNRITFNTRFVMKTFMTTCPGTILLVIIILLWLGFSWILRLCDSYHSVDFDNYGNAIWLIAVTFFSIGYGDIVPVTLCGRVISILTGITGAGSTAFVVAVVARKLELSRAEKHVHNFMLDTHLTKTLKNAAANVLRETWLIYKYTKLVKRVNPGKVRDHQRKFLQALQALRKVKLDQRKLNDNANQLVDIAKIHTQLAERMDETQEDQASMLQRIESLEEKINSLQKSVDTLPQTVVDKFIQRTLELARATPADPAVAVPEFLLNASAPDANTSACSNSLVGNAGDC